MITYSRTFSIDEMNNQSPICTTHLPINISLKQHQLAAIHKCTELENQGISISNELISEYKDVKSNIGIFADKVGSGKSYSILGLLLANRVPLVRFSKTMSYGLNNIHVCKRDLLYTSYYDLNIIVVPHNIIKQWSSYISQFSDALKFYIVNTQKTFDNMHESMNDSKILLVSSTFYKKVCVFFIDNNYHVNRVIFDEVDSANTPNAKSIPAYFYWFISASYKNILNPYPRWHYDRYNWNNSYMISSGINNNILVKNIFSNLLRSSLENAILDKIIIKNSDIFVDDSFKLPDLRKNIILCKSSIEVNVLNGIINSNILSSLNAGDTKGAISNLNPDIVDTENNIIDHVKKDLEVKLTNISLNIECSKQMIYTNSTTQSHKIQKLEKERNEIIDKMQLLQDRIVSNQSCIICYNEPNNKCITKCCKNVFCMKCLSTWFTQHPTCPLCKVTMNWSKNIYVVDDNSNANKLDVNNTTTPNNTTHFTKYEHLEKILTSRNEKSKFLIFSEYDNSFESIVKIVQKLKLNYAHLKGNNINSTVKHYKCDDPDLAINVLFMNSRSYGSGLNLENTTDVILFHRFESEIEKQVIGRAQRPGRSNALNVWYLLHENEA